MAAWRTISLWMDQLDEPLVARPALEQDLDVDVAIIGAGYTGLWTAFWRYLCTARGDHSPGKVGARSGSDGGAHGGQHL